MGIVGASPHDAGIDRYEPGDRAAQLRVRVIDTGRLPEGVLAWWQHDRRTVWMRRGLSARQQRSTLMHEVIHVERGDETCVLDRHLRRRELQVEDAAARRLVPTIALATALRTCWTVYELSMELQIDLAMTQRRLVIAKADLSEIAMIAELAKGLGERQLRLGETG